MAGQTYLIFGKSSGWSMDTDLSNADASFWGEDSGDYSGYSVSGAGDVNGDGYDDILIGAYFNDDGGSQAGQTYLILGKASGWSMDTDLSSVDASFWGEDSGDYSGISVSGAGDVDGDGYDDILIGAVFDEDGGTSAGQSYLILGKSSGWSMDTDLSNADASFWGENAGVLSGGSVSGAGDVNGDGYDDILICAHYDDESNTDAGQTYLIFGKSSGWSMDTDLSNADASFLGENSGDRSGVSVSGAGDTNGDGYDDILIGANFNDEGGSDSGQSYLILGKSSGWSMDTYLSNADASFWAEGANDNSGHSVSGAGDLNGDGYDDIIIDAPGNDDGGTGAGKTYLILSNVDPPGPKNLATSLSSSKSEVTLRWSVPDTWSYPVDCYRIYRSSEVGEKEYIGFTSNTTTTFADNTTILGVTYNYEVIADYDLGDNYLGRARISVLCDIDTDSDGIGNMADTDDDGDGYDDGRDMFPLDRREYLDTDLDGHGNFADMDDDNDGVLDMLDPYPLNPLDGTMTLLDDVETSISGLNSFIQEINGSLSRNLSRIELMLGDVIDTQSDHSSILMGIDTNLTSLMSDVDTLGNDVRSLLSEVISDLSGVNKTLKMQISDLEDQFKTDVASLLSAMDDLETSIQIDIDALSDDMDSFRSWMELQMTGLMEMIGDENEDLSTLITTEIDQLETKTLAELHSVMDGLMQSFSENDTSILNKLIEMNVELIGFENSSFERLESISNDMATLQTMDELSSDIEGIDQDLEMLSDLEKEIAGVSDDQEDASGKIGLGNILNIVIIVLLIAVLGVLGYSIWKRREDEEETWK